jgi:hypothetical protein
MTFINSLLFVVCVFLTSGEIWLTVRRQRFWSPQVQEAEIKVFSFETPALFVLVFLAPGAWLIELFFVLSAQFTSPHLQGILILSLIGIIPSLYCSHKNLVAAIIPEKWPD